MPEGGRDLPAAIAQVFTTDEPLVRPAPAPGYLSEKLALQQDLASNMADHPAEVLPRLVRLSMEACDAGSAGVSVLDGDVFHWNSLVGKLSVLEGATTPRNFSPCGVCLDQSSPILMERPERAYSWIAEANITAPEILLVPLLRNGTIPVGTMIPMPTSSVISSGIEAVLDGGSRGTVKADEPPQAVSYAMPSRPRHA